MGIFSRRVGAVGIGCALLLVACPVQAEEPGYAYTAATGIGASICTLVYGPAKIARAVGGTVVSGLALLFTFDPGIAGPILRSSVRGDYVVTPAHLEGRRSLRFDGRG